MDIKFLIEKRRLLGMVNIFAVFIAILNSLFIIIIIIIIIMIIVIIIIIIIIILLLWNLLLYGLWQISCLLLPVLVYLFFVQIQIEISN